MSVNANNFVWDAANEQWVPQEAPAARQAAGAWFEGDFGFLRVPFEVDAGQGTVQPGQVIADRRREVSHSEWQALAALVVTNNNGSDAERLKVVVTAEDGTLLMEEEVPVDPGWSTAFEKVLASSDPIIGSIRVTVAAATQITVGVVSGFVLVAIRKATA